MPEEAAREELGAHLIVAGALTMAGAGVLAWTAISSGDRTYFAFSAYLFAAGAALFLRQPWARYPIYLFAAGSVIWWSITAWWAVRGGDADQTALTTILSLVPGLIWCAFWLSLCLTVHRAFPAGRGWRGDKPSA